MEYLELTSYEAEIKNLETLFQQTFGDAEGAAEGKNIGQLVHGLLTTTPKDEIRVFVAKDDQEFIGSILLTKFGNEQNINAYLLSPVAVSTKHQGKKIGQQLINFAFSLLKVDGVETVVSYGDPNFYSRVGFQQITEEVITSPHHLSFPIGWIAAPLQSDQITPMVGKNTCAPALDDPKFW
ncbi:N-acetyltransferase [Flammeovirga sp. SubArs3]|uniref:GNAT family N-acetyltransferase n=1 Tax=Flammeovirga sp. SubArs3 TaxID=2995316 RepID=UPI00248BA9AA|nr:N-acetyltransferase [Flammeovirga sp. SubArs3]